MSGRANRNAEVEAATATANDGNGERERERPTEEEIIGNFDVSYSTLPLSGGGKERGESKLADPRGININVNWETIHGAGNMVIALQFSTFYGINYYKSNKDN